MRAGQSELSVGWTTAQHIRTRTAVSSRRRSVFVRAYLCRHVTGCLLLPTASSHFCLCAALPLSAGSFLFILLPVMKEKKQQHVSFSAAPISDPLLGRMASVVIRSFTLLAATMKLKKREHKEKTNHIH